MGFPVNFCGVSLAFFRFACGLAYVEHAMSCMFSWFGLTEPNPQELYQRSSAILCVSGAQIRERLPVIAFRDFTEKCGVTEEDIMCAVCLCSFEANDEIRELGNCCHAFHRNCLEKWIDLEHKRCPLCRSPLVGETEILEA
ncbi:hypothetical protein SUGI_1190550 [Cryptomeria japonica]|nr:hypothetical protein SUGI_1190550 [Cryptomeria japonica]